MIGAYTWTQLVLDAPWSDRWRQTSFFDANHFLIVLGGSDGDTGALYNDVWKSTTAIDVNIAEECTVPLSPCGKVGLQCLPTEEDTAFTTPLISGTTTISCAACSATSTTTPQSTSSSSNALTSIFLFVFLALFLISVLFAVYLLSVMRSSGARAPFPLPDFLQSYWTSGSNTLQASSSSLSLQPSVFTADTASHTEPYARLNEGAL